MHDRIMYVELKDQARYGDDGGPAWIGRVSFSKSWRTAYYRDRTLERSREVDGNHLDLDSGEVFWISGPKRDRKDRRYSNAPVDVDDDVRSAYEAYLKGAELPHLPSIRAAAPDAMGRRQAEAGP